MVFNFFFWSKQTRSPTRQAGSPVRKSATTTPASSPIYRNPTSRRQSGFPSLPSCRSATARRGCPPPSDTHPFFDDPSVFQQSRRLSVAAAQELSSMKKIASVRFQQDLKGAGNTKDVEQELEKEDVITTERHRSASFGEIQPPPLRRQSAMSLFSSEDDSLSSIEKNLLGIPAISRLPAPRSASTKLRNPPHRRHVTLVSDISRLEAKLLSECEEIVYLQAALKESVRRGSLLKPHSTRIQAALTKKQSEYKMSYKKFVEKCRFPDEGEKNEFHPFPRKPNARKSQLMKQTMFQKQNSVPFDPATLSLGYQADDDISVAGATDGGSPARVPNRACGGGGSPFSAYSITPASTEGSDCGNKFRALSLQDSVRSVDFH